MRDCSLQFKLENCISLALVSDQMFIEKIKNKTKQQPSVIIFQQPKHGMYLKSQTTSYGSNF